MDYHRPICEEKSINHGIRMFRLLLISFRKSFTLYLGIVLLLAGNPVVGGGRLKVHPCPPAVVVVVAQPDPGSTVPLVDTTTTLVIQ